MGARLSKSRMALASLMILALSTTLIVAASQGYLQITIDASEDDWKPSGWTSPGGKGCPVPTKDYNAFRCCNTTGTPRQCQLVWRDADDAQAEDIHYARLYLDKTGLYFFARADMYLQKDVILWLNTSSYRLKINITGRLTRQGIPPPGYELYCLGSTKRSSAGRTEINPRDTGARISRNIEAHVPFDEIFKGTNCDAVQEGSYSVSITFMGDRMTVGDGTGTRIVTLGVDNYYIVDAYYVMSGTTTPIPVPEPGVLVAASIIASAIVLGAAFFTRRSFI